MGRWDGLYGADSVAGQHLAVTGVRALLAAPAVRLGFDEALAGFKARERWTAGEWQAYERGRSGSCFRGSAQRFLTIGRPGERGEKKRLRRGDSRSCHSCRRSRSGRIRGVSLRFARGGACYVFHTSGSTGTPVQTLWTRLRSGPRWRCGGSLSGLGGCVLPSGSRDVLGAARRAGSKKPRTRLSGTTRLSTKSTCRISSSSDTAACYVEALRRHRSSG